VFSKVKGRYDGKTVYPNLYSFIIAPPASDKNTLVFAKHLGLQIHRKLFLDYQEKMKTYRLKKNESTDDPDQNGSKEFSSKPNLKILYIPANSSSASVISHLMHNDGIGIIVESEADTLTNTFKQDWGGYSDLLRKAFHHEPISYSRKKENEFYEINQPRLSIALAGTPSQVTGLIKSPSDGLFSRFIFYAYSVKQEWRDVSAANKIDLTSYFENYGQSLKNIYEILEAFEYEFKLPEKHWEVFNDHFRKLLKQTERLTGKDSPSTVKRLGLITYKIAMVLTILRQFQEGSLPSEILVCGDDDFANAMFLAKVYFQHSLFMLESLQKESGELPSSIGITKYYNGIRSNKHFKRADLHKLSNMCPRTIDSYIKQLVDQKLLYKTKHGEFWKPLN
jgi:hypothetical protein